jgi:hypothetical protein
MKQKDVFNKIGEIIQELSDQYDDLEKVKGNLNDLELELFIANAHFLTEHIDILCKLNLQKNISQQSTEKPEVTNRQKYFEPVVQQMKQAEAAQSKLSIPSTKLTEPENEHRSLPNEQPTPKTNKETSVDTNSSLHKEPETIRHQLILDESMYQDDDENIFDDDLEETETILPIAKGVNPAASKQETETDNNTNEEVPTINQRISSQLGNTAIRKTEQLSKKPIDDLKLAITLNDKLLFVKDLFNGYNLAYSEAIDILNRFNSYDEAIRFLKTSYVTKNNWDSKSATAEKFYELLGRRYS